MKYFFILSHGRSGSKFLADLLARDPSAVVFHEPYRGDYFLLPYGYYCPNSTVLRGLLKERFEWTTRHLVRRERIYGEVNSLLRYHVDWLRESLDASIMHLVRDGRAVVKSTYLRSVYTGWDSHLPVVPRNDDPYSLRWSELTRFERLCWYWNETNVFLLEKVSEAVRFEDILQDFEYFRRMVLEPTGLKIPREVWERERRRRKNATKPELVPRRVGDAVRSVLGGRRQGYGEQWPGWTEEMERRFNDICGATMRRLGYA